VLERGRIVEEGTHAALLESGRRYAALSRLQNLERELEAM
jgi:ABC-type multidrug transport system fused ATPase/permease subunit